MKHIQPIIRCAGGAPPRSIPRQAWIRLVVGAAAFAAVAALALHLIS